MTAHSDDVKIADMLAPLRDLEPLPFAPKRLERRWTQRPVLVAAVVTAALALTGVAIAAGFGGFSGFSATQHPQTAADQLDAQARASIHTACSGLPGLPAPSFGFYSPYCHLELDTARYLTDTGFGGRKVWVIADTRGDLCAVGGFGGCYPPLTRSQPITFGSENPGPIPGHTGTFTAAGLAMDGVTSVSFVPVPGDGKEVTVPVKDNIWVYTEPKSDADLGHCVVAHFADGSSVDPFPEVPCP